MARHKDGCDGEQVVCEFASIIAVCFATVNHECCANLFKDELQQLNSVSAQAVFVHNHNLLDHAAEHAFQKGVKRFTFEVEATADIGEDVVVWVGCLQI